MSTDDDSQLDHTFAALADPTRRRIVRRLLAGDATVGDLAAPFDMSLAAVSKHISALAQAGLVTQRREGRVKWCRLDIDSLHDASVWLSAFGGFAARDMDILQAGLEELGLISDEDQ